MGQRIHVAIDVNDAVDDAAAVHASVRRRAYDPDGNAWEAFLA